MTVTRATLFDLTFYQFVIVENVVHLYNEICLFLTFLQFFYFYFQIRSI